MQIVDFTAAHTERAALIAKQNYDEERGHVPALPAVDKLPDLSGFAEQGRGVAAMDGGELLGFFCWLAPWENHFGQNKGTWSPIHAHGAITEKRGEICDRLYQAAAEKLVSEGVFSHSVTLYEHDAEGNKSFAHNGFGMRCVDAVRETSPIILPHRDGVTYRQAGKNDAEAIADMSSRTNAHLNRSPMFMPRFDMDSAADIIRDMDGDDHRFFIALYEDRPSAYYRIQSSAENFACDDASMMNITGAFALPEVRGSGVAAGLLSWLMDWLRECGYTRCGVDFECFNYTARKFWLKYFTPYTNGATRRIDERIGQP